MFPKGTRATNVFFCIHLELIAKQLEKFVFLVEKDLYFLEIWVNALQHFFIYATVQFENRIDRLDKTHKSETKTFPQLVFHFLKLKIGRTI